MVSDLEGEKTNKVLCEFILAILEQELVLGNKINDLVRLLDFMNTIITSAIISSNLSSNEITELFDYMRDNSELSEKRVRQHL